MNLNLLNCQLFHLYCISMKFFRFLDHYYSSKMNFQLGPQHKACLHCKFDILTIVLATVYDSVSINVNVHFDKI